MRKMPQHKVEGERAPSMWQIASNDRCLVCGRQSNGKAICPDPNCASELALG